MALCFRLYFVKDSTISGTAAATVRQMVSVVFDRVVTEDSNPKGLLSTSNQAIKLTKQWHINCWNVCLPLTYVSPMGGVLV